MLYFRLIGARIRAQMQYPVSFWLELFGFALVTSLEFVVVVILVNRFGSVAGWSVTEIALLYGLTSLAFSLAEMIGRGFDSPFERMIAQGTFDGVLARPLGSFFQVLSSEFQLRRLGRSFQALIVLGYALSQLPMVWRPSSFILIPLTVLSGMLIYIALMVIGATLCFWTIRTPEVINIFTAGGAQMTTYPLSMYHEWLRTVFLALVPVGFANYPASLYLLERTDPNGLPAWSAWAAPVVALLFFGLALRFWAFGVAKYASTGS